MLSSKFWRNFLPAGKDFTIPARNFLPAGNAISGMAEAGGSSRNGSPRFLCSRAVAFT
jgi:hypothetical protein